MRDEVGVEADAGHGAGHRRGELPSIRAIEPCGSRLPAPRGGERWSSRGWGARPLRGEELSDRINVEVPAAPSPASPAAKRSSPRARGEEARRRAAAARRWVSRNLGSPSASGSAMRVRVWTARVRATARMKGSRRVSADVMSSITRRACGEWMMSSTSRIESLVSCAITPTVRASSRKRVRTRLK